MQKKAVFSVILAGILWGVISIFINNLSAAGLDSLQISLVRLSVAALVFVSFIAVKDRTLLRIRLRDIWMFVGTGIVSVTLFNTCYFYTMIASQASIAVVLLYTSPVWIMLMSAVLFKEKITARKLTALIITISGCVCVTGLLEGRVVITLPVLLTGIASGVFYGLYTIFGKYALAKYDSMTVTAYTFLFGVIGSLPFGKIGKTAAVIKSNPAVLVWCVGIGIISTVLPYFFYTSGLKNLDSGRASILVAVEPLVGAVIGMTVYHESHGVMKLVGIVLILGAIVILNLPGRSRGKTEAGDKNGVIVNNEEGR